jgi:hypothetical protein
MYPLFTWHQFFSSVRDPCRRTDFWFAAISVLGCNVYITSIATTLTCITHIKILIVCGVCVVPRREQQHDEPWQHAKVNAREVPSQLSMLFGSHVEVRVRGSPRDVHHVASLVEVVVEIGW